MEISLQFMLSTWYVSLSPLSFAFVKFLFLNIFIVRLSWSVMSIRVRNPLGNAISANLERLLVLIPEKTFECEPDKCKVWSGKKFPAGGRGKSAFLSTAFHSNGFYSHIHFVLPRNTFFLLPNVFPEISIFPVTVFDLNFFSLPTNATRSFRDIKDLSKFPLIMIFLCDSAHEFCLCFLPRASQHDVFWLKFFGGWVCVSCRRQKFS